MANYTFVAADLKSLYNKKFQVHDLGLKRNVDFIIPDEKTARYRRGAEGFGLLVECKHPVRGPVRSFMKIFSADVPERRPRTNFLIQLGLAARHPWMFQGVPYAWLPEVEISGVPVVSHVAQDLGGQSGGTAEDFHRLKVNDKWDSSYSLQQRKLFAGHLCVAVATMEQMGLVHGDLSAGNVMIGPGPSGPVLCLCDFDGFYHPKVQPLPRVFGTQDLRPLGTAGYQYPEILMRIAREKQAGQKDLGILVQSDRFALAALACELVIWSPDLGMELGRDELLTTHDIESRTLPALPAKAANIWPQGLDGLQQALAAKSISDMPSPEDWLGLLGVNLLPHKRFSASPRLSIFKLHGRTRTPIANAQISGDKTADLSTIKKELASVKFKLNNGLLYFKFDWQGPKIPVFRTRDGRKFTVPPDDLVEVSQDGSRSPKFIEVSPGERLSSNFWEIDFHDGIPTV